MIEISTGQVLYEVKARLYVACDMREYKGKNQKYQRAICHFVVGIVGRTEGKEEKR